jgi:uncharacterized protein
VPTTDASDGADVLFTSDLHGSETMYREAFALSSRLGVRALLLGGDLAPHGDVAGQRRFFRDFFLPCVRQFLEQRPGTEIFFIFGNDDWRASMSAIESAGVAQLHHVHARAVPFLDGSWVAGLASVPVTPFGMKDWDRWEDGLSASSRLDGMRSAPDGTLRPFTLAGKERQESMAADLASLERALPPGEPPLVCLFHGPPHGTALDQVAPGVHVGSRETRRFLERRGALLGLHGHIHESPMVSGRFADRVGSTTCVNAGQRREGPLHAVWFRMADPAASLTHSILGRADI